MSGLDALAAMLDAASGQRRSRGAGSRRRRAAMPRILEKTEQANGVRLLYAIGCPRVYVLGTRRAKGDYQGTRQTPGISDVICFLPRVLGVLFWEVKAKGGKPSEAQAELAELVTACQTAGLGIHYCVGTYDDLIAWLTAFGLLKADQVPHYRLPRRRGIGLHANE